MPEAAEAATKAEAALNSSSSSVLSTPSQSLSLALPPSVEPSWEGRRGSAGNGVAGAGAAAVGEDGGERVMRRLSSLKAITVEMSLATR